MSYIIFQLTLLLLVAVLLTALTRFKWLAWLLSVWFAAILSLQMSSVYLGGSLIDYKYYLHTGTVDVNLMTKFFLWETILTFIVFLLLGVFVFYLSRRLRKWKKWPFRFTAAAFIGIIMMSFPGGVLKELYDIMEMTTVADANFDAALTALNIPVVEYVRPEKAKAKKGKNIIAISLESFEQGFLREPLTHLTPNLNKLADENTYFNMLQSPGSGWTSASVYTSITGFPAYFKSKPNNVFQGAAGLKLTGVGQVLKAAGYDLTYMLGNKNFAGIDKMMSAYHFDVRSEVDFKRKYPWSPWGLHDKDLFEEAKQVVLEKRKKGKPFALFMSTISTHLPKGVYDYRMKELVAPQRSPLEFMIAAVDYIVGDFVRFLDEEGMLENTSFYIYPDHLIMGTSPVILQDFKSLRELYLITNAEEKDLSYKTEEKICQLDIPKIILEGAGVKHNVKFFRDFIPAETSTEGFINQHKKEIVALNEASLKTEGFMEGLQVEFNGKKSIRLISASASQSAFDVDTAPDKAHVFTFDNKARYIKNESTTLYEAFETNKYKKNGLVYLITCIKNNQLFAYLRKKNRIGVARKGDKTVSFSKDDFEVLLDWKFSGDEFRLPSRPDYETPFDMLYLTSGVGGLGKLNTPGEIRIGSYKLPVKKGINLLTKVDEEYRVTNFDLSANIEKASDLAQSIQQLNQQKQFFALVAQEWSTDLKQYVSIFEKAGCRVLGNLKPGETYLGYAYRGYISEYKLDKPFSINLPDAPRPSLRSQEQIDLDARDTRKFIAHAGGAIDGNTYTNSLDALNLSYEKGYRIFELDIIKTSDGHFVAAHDWKYWAKQTKFKGQTPVAKAEFLQQKIKGKYTLMDMAVINKWFTNHPDATLVTDKINEPQQFASEFVDKERLMMELFSLEAVEEAVKAGVRPMPSEWALDKVKGGKITWLKEKGIKQVALSRTIIRQKLAFIKALKANDIKVFVYHVNGEIGKNEAYVVCNDFDWVWGMYADEWSF